MENANQCTNNTNIDLPHYPFIKDDAIETICTLVNKIYLLTIENETEKFKVVEMNLKTDFSCLPLTVTYTSIIQ